MFARMFWMHEGWWKWCSLVVVALGLIGAPRSAAAKGAAGSCGCSDVNDLINRIALAHAAQEKFRAEIPAIAAQQQPVNYDGVARGSSQMNYDVLKASVVLAQTAVQDPTAHAASGSTDGLTCKPVVKAATACLTEVLEVHENYHQRVCTNERRNKRLGKLQDRFKDKPLLEYVNEELDGYQLEIDEAVRRLRAIQGSCRPRGWVGTIRVTETRSMNVTTTTPGTNQYSDGTTRTSETQFRRWGTIVRGRAPETAYWQVQELTKGHDTWRGRVGCSGGLKTKPADRRVTNTTHQEMGSSGVSTVVPPVDISVDGTRYAISFEIPAVKGEGTMTGYNKSSGGCDDFNTPTSGGPFPYEIPASDAIRAEGTMKPNDTYLGGSQTFNLTPGASGSGVTSSHDRTVYWHLHKLD